MKSLLKNFLLAAAAALLLAGCSGLGTGDVTVEAEGLTEGRTLLTINVADFMNQATSAKKAARTINPAAFEGDETENEEARGLIKKYVLKGTSVTTGEQLKNAAGEALEIAATGEITGGIQLGSTEAPSSGETDSDGNVQYKVSIPYGSWELTLYALDTNNKPLLQGQTFAVLKTAQSAIRFTLTTDGLTTPGAVDIAGTFVDAGNVAIKYKAGLYDLNSGEKVYPATDITAQPITAGTPAFAYAATGVTPGRYSFQVRFYKDDACEKQVGFYEDVLVVAPGRTTNRQNITCGNIIMQRPNAPENLRAFLKNDSDTVNGYTVILTWDDKSNNEENFVVTLKEYNTETVEATTNPIKTVILGLENDDTNEEIFFGNKINKGGSLIASSTKCSLLLSYGKIYEVEIQAQNYVGFSDYTPATTTIDVTPRNTDALASGATLPTGVTADDILFTTAKINRLKIKYNLDGGSLAIPEGYYGTDSAGRTQTGGIYPEYKNIYSIASADRVLSKVLLDIKEADATKPTLTNGTYKFLKWAYNDGSDFATNAAITYKGLDVKAIYDKTTKVSYKIVNQYGNIIQSEVTAVYDGQDLVPEVKIGEDSEHNDIMGPGHKAYKEGESIVFTVTPAAADKTVDWISVTIGNSPYADIYSGEVNAATYTFSDVAMLEVGPHTANVKVHITGDDADVIYAFTFTFEIDR